MRKVTLLTVLLISASAIAATVTVSDPGSNYRNGSFNGGEFKADPGTGYVGETGWYSDLSADTFETFCVEVGETVNLPGTYTATINTKSLLSNVNLNPKTAWLYWNFRNGGLSTYGFNYTAGAGRAASSQALQQAIWYFQGMSGGVANALVTAANSFGWTNTIGSVRILNLWDVGNGQARQDILTIVPIPAAVLLGLLGMAATTCARRR